MARMGRKSKLFGGLESVNVDGIEFYSLSELAKYFGVNTGTFYDRCEAFGLQKAIEFRGINRTYEVDNKAFSTKADVAKYFGLSKDAFGTRVKNLGVDKAIEHLKDVTEVFIEDGETKRRHLKIHVDFEDGYSYTKNLATDTISINFKHKTYGSCADLARDLNCGNVLVLRLLEICLKTKNISILKNMDFRVEFNGKVVHGMNGLYEVLPTMNQGFLCKSIQQNTISKLDQIITEYNDNWPIITVGARKFVDYNELIKYLGLTYKGIDLWGKRRIFYDRLREKGLKDALAHYFQLYVIGINPDGHTIIQYKCPVCGKTLVANMNTEESMAHSEEFCRAHSVEDWTPPKDRT